jgi:hypothetical protein
LYLPLVFTKQDDMIREGQHRNLVSFVNINATGILSPFLLAAAPDIN